MCMCEERSEKIRDILVIPKLWMHVWLRNGKSGSFSSWSEYFKCLHEAYWRSKFCLILATSFFSWLLNSLSLSPSPSFLLLKMPFHPQLCNTFGKEAEKNLTDLSGPVVSNVIIIHERRKAQKRKKQTGKKYDEGKIVEREQTECNQLLQHHMIFEFFSFFCSILTIHLILQLISLSCKAY